MRGLRAQCGGPTAPASRRTRTPVKASTQRGGSPRQADRSPACNRRLLRRGHTGWDVAGGERPVRNHVPCLTGHIVNPIRPRRPASLRVLCQRAPMQNVFCMGTQARAMTHVGSCPSACGQGSLACGPPAEKSVNGHECWGWAARWLGTEGWKCGLEKQGDPSGPGRCSWPTGPKSRPAGVRASVGARKRGHARGAKGRREVEA